MKIHIGIRSSSPGARWVLITLYYNMFSYILTYTLGLPRSLLYIGDLLTIWTFLYALKVRQKFVVPKSFLYIILFTFVGILGAIINSEPVFFVICGLRNSLRYVLFLYSCYVLLQKSDLDRVFRLLWVIFWISVPLCTIERFFVSYPSGTIVGDMVGGIFWNYSGCNLPLNVILCICLCQATIEYFASKISVFKFTVVCICALYMSATAELKVFIFEFIVIILFAAVNQKIRWNKIIVLIIGAFVFSNIVTLFVALNSSSSYDYSSIFTINGFLEYATRSSGYNGTGDLNRLTGVSTIATDIFNNDLKRILIGIGIGNAEYTNYFSSNFYLWYSYLNYQWFHMIWMFIETGLLGILLYLLFFISIFRKACRSKIKDLNMTTTKIMIVVMLILFVYNISLRSEASGYLLFLLLSIPYIYSESEKEIEYDS